MSAWVRAARDMRCTWPHVKITLLFFPWDWRLVPRGYASIEPARHDEDDDHDGCGHVWGTWLVLEVSASWNRPLLGIWPVADVYRQIPRGRQ